MAAFQYPHLRLADWQPSRDTLRTYAKLLGKLKQVWAAPQKNFWHYGLFIGSSGLTTGQLLGPEYCFSLALNLNTHKLVFTADTGQTEAIDLVQTSPQSLTQAVVSLLDRQQLHPTIDQALFTDGQPAPYSPGQVQTYWRTLSRLHALFAQFRAGLAEETSPIQVFPHHFDLSLTWLSTQTIPDPAKPGQTTNAQINFGWSTGDEAIAEAYFYATPYPVPADLSSRPAPPAAHWQTEGFAGAVLRYQNLIASSNADQALLEFLRSAQQTLQTN